MQYPHPVASIDQAGTGDTRSRICARRMTLRDRFSSSPHPNEEWNMSGYVGSGTSAQRSLRQRAHDGHFLLMGRFRRALLSRADVLFIPWPGFSDVALVTQHRARLRGAYLDVLRLGASHTCGFCPFHVFQRGGPRGGSDAAT